MKPFILDVDNIVDYLVNKDIVGKKSIIDSDLKIIPCSSKNCNFQVLTKNGTSLMVKQPFSSEMENNYSSLSVEANLYLETSKFPDLEYIFPTLIEFDNDQQILITELLPLAKPLYTYIQKPGRKDLYVELFRLLGRFIATYQRKIRADTLDSEKLHLRSDLPPLLDLLCHPSSHLFVDLSKGNIELIKIIQKNNLGDLVNQVMNNWSVECLVNLDMKLQNVIVYSHKSNANASNMPKIKLVDWEYGILGDAMWDLGCIFNDFICYWLFSLDLSRNKSTSDVISLSKRPLTEMQSYIRATWQGYVETLETSPDRQAKLLMKAILYCASRLLQTAYESQFSLPYLSKTALSLLQVSLNIFKNPKQAAIYLLGLPNII